MPALDLSQSEDPSFTIYSPIIIAGLIVIALIFCGTFSWLGFRWYQKRVVAKRESEMGAAVLPVNGSRNTHGALLSNNEKAVIYPVSKSQPHMIIPASVHFAPSARPRHADLNIPGLRQSRISLPQSRISMLSTFSIASTISNSSGGTRKVRQKFEPVLPDELLPLLGERLTVVQSFDDGWCVVARENSTFVHAAKSLFKKPESGENTEFGVIPAWCFLKPTKGSRPERPLRTSSLDVTVDMDGPASRMEMMSWSKF